MKNIGGQSVKAIKHRPSKDHGLLVPPNFASPEQKRITQDLLRFLAKCGVEYCIMGRTNYLPYFSPGDIDIVVRNDSLRGFLANLLVFCKHDGLRIVQLLQHEHGAFYFVLTRMIPPHKPAFVLPDICGDYYRYGRLFLSAEEIIASRTLAKDSQKVEQAFYVASPAVEFIYYLLKRIDKQSLDEEHGMHLGEQWRKDRAKALAQVRRFFDEKSASLLVNALDLNTWVDVRRSLPRLRRTLRANVIKPSVKVCARELRRRYRRFMYPTGLHVAFLGMDGSGKSTVIKNVHGTIAPVFRQTRIFHVRPFVGLGQRLQSPVLQPHGTPSRGLAGCITKIVYYLFDYCVGWLLVVRPMLVRSTLVIFDRYYHDVLVDPLRYRCRGPMAFMRWVGKLIPKPDLWILLDAPPEVVVRRKNELLLSEAKRQRAEYLRFTKNTNNAVVVDASEPLDEVVGNVNEVVLNFMAERTKKRFRMQYNDI